MSIIRCDDCSELIDSDEFPEAYVEELDKWLCPGCWETYEMEKEEKVKDYKFGTQLSVSEDTHGYVILQDIMGSDTDIANSARISYDYQGPSKDRTLLRYLMRHRHTSPFEMAELKFEIKMPIFVARQWIRHRTANVNEMSARYTQLPAEMFVPEYISAQSETNKQGRREDGPLANSDRLRERIGQSNRFSYADYQELLTEGVTRELARGVLPLNIYTKMIWKIDLHNLFHFLKLRLDHHAQKEIRVYAEVLEKLVEQFFPTSYEAFVDYSKEAYTLSRMEVETLREVLNGADFGEQRAYTNKKFCHEKLYDEGGSKREIESFDKIFFQPKEES